MARGMPTAQLNMAILDLKERIASNFTSSHWHDIGLLTNSVDLISNHPRLLRSLSFGDEDYEGHVTQVLLGIIRSEGTNFEKIQEYVDHRFDHEGIYISSKPSKKKITFAPNVFAVPETDVRNDLVAVMMPFAGFDSVYNAIKSSCADAGLQCLRADDIWDESTFIQDIVNLIFQARIVVCDFSKRNPNVFYETGIAHTLGKEVIPIAQSLSDIPSDLQHHRALPYLANAEGLQKLRADLSNRMKTIANRP